MSPLAADNGGVVGGQIGAVTTVATTYLVVIAGCLGAGTTSRPIAGRPTVRTDADHSVEAGRRIERSARSPQQQAATV